MRGAPALDARVGRVPQVDRHRIAAGHHPQCDTPAVDVLAQRLGDALRQPCIAFGPGQHRIALVVLTARRTKPVPARKVVQPGPGRHLVRTGAVVVAAAVVEVPAQRRRGEPFTVQPLRERELIQRVERRAPRRSPGRDRERRTAAELGHALGETAVVREGRCTFGGRQRVDRRQQPLMPVAGDEQALLRAVAQVAFVVHGQAVDDAAQAQLAEQLCDLVGMLARRRQVVGAERAGDAGDAVTAAVAAGAVFELEELHIVDAAAQQCARAGEAGDAGADDRDAGLALHRRRGQAAAFREVAQPVAAFMLCADPAAGVTRRLAARTAGEPGAQRQRRARREQRAPAPHQCTLPHSCSKVCTSTWFDSRFGSAATRAMSGGKLNSAVMPSRLRKRKPAGKARGS